MYCAFQICVFSFFPHSFHNCMTLPIWVEGERKKNKTEFTVLEKLLTGNCLISLSLQLDGSCKHLWCYFTRMQIQLFSIPRIRNAESAAAAILVSQKKIFLKPLASFIYLRKTKYVHAVLSFPKVSFRTDDISMWIFFLRKNRFLSALTCWSF